MPHEHQPLTEQQEAYCHNILEGMTQADAYLRAGYGAKSRKNAGVAGCLLRKDPRVAARIADLKSLRDTGRAREINSAVDKLRELNASPSVPDLARELAGLDGGLSPEFQALAGDMLTRKGRAAALVSRRLKLLEIAQARGADIDILQAPGGLTGFVTIDYKSVGGEKKMVSKIDDGLLGELRATEQQIARELGQWVERMDETVTVRGLEDLDDAALEKIMREAEEVAARTGVVLPTAGSVVQ